MIFQNYLTFANNNIILGLDRILLLLSRLNNPHLNLPPVIHIAGTNGKGSVLAFLKSIFNQANYLVHRYTSPHLVKFNERIEIANKIISDEQLNQLTKKCYWACELQPKITPTFFEFTTAMAFLAFSQQKADIVLLETGLGGEFDATNVLSQVLLSIITTISFDHQEYLGNSIEQIAKAKAGIIKHNCPVVIATQNLQAKQVLWRIAQEKQARIIDANIEKLPNQLLNIKPSLLGKHQISNLKLAYLAVLNQNKFQINLNDMVQGAKKTQWSARMQKIECGAIKQSLKNCQLYLDGAHNLDGAKIIDEFLSTKKKYKRIAVFNILQNKNLPGFLQQIKDNLDLLLIIDVFFHPQQNNAKDIFTQAKQLNIATQIIDNFTEINNFLESKNDTVVICGSLYLAGKFLALNSLSSKQF
jgi:dihydrofolate synthase/folylpolyglutamate synthase